jgi:hypothetical protein
MAQRKRQYSGVFDYYTGRQVLRVGLYCGDYGDKFIGTIDDGYDCDCRVLYDPGREQVLAFGCSMYGRPYAYPRDPTRPREPPAQPARAEPEPPSVDPSTLH